MALTVSAGGTVQLLEMLERASVQEGAASLRGRGSGIPAPRERAAPPDAAAEDAGRFAHGVAVLPDSGVDVAGPVAPTGPPLLPAPAPARDAARRVAPRTPRLGVIAGVAGAGLLAACWSGASAMLADRVPDGATVAGVAIGGMERDEAVRILATRLQPRLETPLAVTAGGRSATVDPAVAGLELDAAASVSHAIGPVGLPTTLWHQLRGRGDVEPVVVTGAGDLAAAVDRVAVALDVPAVDGAIGLATGVPVATQPVPGTALDRPAATRLVQRAWLAPTGTARAARPLPLPTREVVPGVSADAVAGALASEAAPALSAPLAVAVADRSVVLQPAQVAPALSMVAGGGALHLRVDGAALADALAAADPAVRTAAQDAQLDTSSGTPVVVPSADGAEPDPESLARSAARALTAEGAARTVTATTRPVVPERTTEAVGALGITTLLGQVVSPLTADAARTHDVTVAAAALDGTIVDAGGQLDLAAVIGEPTAEAGYAPATVVVDGRATSTLAAGSTQLASAVAAAAFAAGLQVDERTAPESWNPRDPMGLDAVVGPQTPLVVSEPGGSGALVRAEVTGGALRVQVWGTGERTVSLSTSPAQDPRPASTVIDGSPECVPQAGQDGFTTTVVRTTTLTGASSASSGQPQPTTDELTTTYAPRTTVVCTSAPAGAAPGAVAPAAPVAID